MGQFNRLIEPIFFAITHVHSLDNQRWQSLINIFILHDFPLDVRSACHDDPLHLHLVVFDENLAALLGHLSDLVLPLFEPQSAETRCRLPTLGMLLRQVNSLPHQYFFVVALQSAEQATITIHHYKSKSVFCCQ